MHSGDPDARADASPHAFTYVYVNAFDEVAAMSAKHEVSMRIGAYMLSIDRVASMHRMRGLYA